MRPILTLAALSLACGNVVDNSNNGDLAGGAAGAGAMGSGGTGAGAGSGGSGAVSGSGGGGAGGAGGTAGTGGTGGLGGSITGSFELHFHPFPASSTTPASEGTTLRLDIDEPTPNEFRAVITPRWGRSSSFEVLVTDTQVTLTGSTSVQGSGNVSDSWRTFELPLIQPRVFGGPMACDGELNVFFGDVLELTPLEGTGFVTFDTTAPEWRSSPSSPNGPPDALLPWDSVRYDIAEPLDHAAVQDALSVVHLAPVGAVPTVDWSFDPVETAERAWAGTHDGTGYFRSWDGILGQDLELRADAGVPDRAGNPGSALATSFRIAPLALGGDWIDFDTDVVEVITWGEARILGGGLIGAVDPNCERIGCVTLGPSLVDLCGGPRNGFATRIRNFATSAPTRVTLRYRVQAEADPSTGGPPSWPPTPFTVEVVEVGGRPERHSADVTDATWTELPTGAIRYTTEWQTFEVPLPAGADEIGLAVFPGDRVAQCDGGPAPPPVSMQVFVDDIRLQ